MVDHAGSVAVRLLAERTGLAGELPPQAVWRALGATSVTADSET